MIWRWTLSLLVVVAGFGCGGSSSTPDAGSSAPPAIETLFPGNNEVATWTEDTTVGKAGVEVATTELAAEALVDGDKAPFEGNFSAFGWQTYVSGTQRLEQRIWRMKSTALASSIFTDILSDSVHGYPSETWENLAVGEAGRIAVSGVKVWVNARKGVDYIEIKVYAVETGGSVEATARADAETFIKAVMAKYK